MMPDYSLVWKVGKKLLQAIEVTWSVGYQLSVIVTDNDVLGEPLRIPVDFRTTEFISRYARFIAYCLHEKCCEGRLTSRFPADRFSRVWIELLLDKFWWRWLAGLHFPTSPPVITVEHHARAIHFPSCDPFTIDHPLAIGMHFSQEMTHVFWITSE